MIGYLHLNVNISYTYVNNLCSKSYNKIQLSIINTGCEVLQRSTTVILKHKKKLYIHRPIILPSTHIWVHMGP
ncbi:hypothetical protein XELAEV_18013566mg [Xenopus laevis]|uniref:Uncharacterized protein n=1 Tax=Xenopus laevis TaxID=8355 RepID=A0A974DRJ5_XENLA|nr:hypothetical protein XELAEV_18013566mg [Xenopus laevis]